METERTLFDFCATPEQQIDMIKHQVSMLERTHENVRRGLFARYAELSKIVQEVRLENAILKQMLQRSN